MVAALWSDQPTVQVWLLPGSAAMAAPACYNLLRACTAPFARLLMPSRCCYPSLRSHINGLALALLLGVDGAILPPAICRATFNVTLEHLADDELWSPQPLGTLLDVQRMQSHWRERHGIELKEVRGLPAHLLFAGV